MYTAPILELRMVLMDKISARPTFTRSSDQRDYPGLNNNNWSDPLPQVSQNRPQASQSFAHPGRLGDVIIKTNSRSGFLMASSNLEVSRMMR
jgi:hypothetical protein